MAVDANHVKLASFNDADPRTWLRTVKSQLKAVTCVKARYNRILSVLPGSVANQVADITNRHLYEEEQNEAAIAAANGGAGVAPAPFDWTAAYNELLTAIESRYSQNDQSAMRTLLEKHQIGNQKPSVYLRQLQNAVAGRKFQCADIIRERFISALPYNIQLAVAHLRTSPLEEVANLADYIFEIPLQHGSVNAVTRSTTLTSTPTPSADNTTAAALEKALTPIAEILQQVTTQLAELKTAVINDGAERGRSRSRSRTGGRDRSESTGWQDIKATEDTCYYHVRFGVRAHKCRPALNGAKCKYDSSGTASVSHVATAAPLSQLTSMENKFDQLLTTLNKIVKTSEN